MLHAHTPTAEQQGAPSAHRGHDAISHAGAPAVDAPGDEPEPPPLHAPPVHCESESVQSSHAPPPAPHALSPAPLQHVPFASQQPPHVWRRHDPEAAFCDMPSAICIAPATAANPPAIA
jgi:hypothetical protein